MHVLYRFLLILLCISCLAACVKREDLDVLELKVSQQDQEIQQLNQKLGKTSKELEAARPEQADMWSDVQSMRSRLAAIESQLEELQQSKIKSDEQHAQFDKQIGTLQGTTVYLDASLRTIASQMAVDLPIYNAATFDAKSTVVGTENATAIPPKIGTVSGTSNEQQKETSALPPSATSDKPANTLVAADGTELVVNPGKAPASPQSVNAVTEQRLYDAAYEAFKDRRYKDALRMWEQFESTYPKHSLVANAVFWQGETNYQLKEYAPAILAYQRVIDKYTKSDKFRSAMLKQGVAFIKLGKNQAAKVRLDELIKKFPKTPEAERAKKALTEIK